MGVPPPSAGSGCSRLRYRFGLAWRRVCPRCRGAPSASLTRSRRAEKTARPALALIAALLLSGCPGDLLKQMDNPRDPQAPSYQGFSTVKAVDDLEAHTPDGAKLMFQTFTVSEVLDADAYQLQISADTGFSVPLYDNDGLKSNKMKAEASLTEETSYYWRGRAKKDGRWGPWTETRAFVFTKTMSGLSPASGSTTTDTTPALSWNAVPGAAGYEVQIADSRAGVASAQAVEVGGTSYTPTTALTNNTTHHWRVRAKDGDGQAGSWSAEHSLVVDDGFVYVEGGSFQMGSTAGYSDEEPVHQVTVSTFYMSRYEVTHGQYLEFLNGAGVSAAGRLNGNEVIDMDDGDVAFSHDGTLFSFSGSEYADSIGCPVMEVTWYGAAEYANWLSAESGLTKVYTINGTSVTANWSANGYRLPTEAEWEYAARGGNASKGYLYAGSDNADEVGWYSSNSGRSTHPVGGKAPNELGLYDMSGNVYEWCWDWWNDSYSSGSQSNPRGPASGSNRVNRGGSWSNSARGLRSANRSGSSPGHGHQNLGFRLVRREF